MDHTTNDGRKNFKIIRKVDYIIILKNPRCCFLKEINSNCFPVLKVDFALTT